MPDYFPTRPQVPLESTPEFEVWSFWTLYVTGFRYWYSHGEQSFIHPPLKIKGQLLIACADILSIQLWVGSSTVFEVSIDTFAMPRFLLTPLLGNILYWETVEAFENTSNEKETLNTYSDEKCIFRWCSAPWESPKIVHLFDIRASLQEILQAIQQSSIHIFESHSPISHNEVYHYHLRPHPCGFVRPGSCRCSALLP